MRTEELGRGIGLARDASAAARRWPLFAAVLAVIALGEQAARMMRRNVPDDAVTSMQYAKNLALGHGLVFNVGERVDGYTNFLWVLFMTPVYAVCDAFDWPFVPAMMHVGVWLAGVCVGLTYLLASEIWENRLAASAAVLFCVVDNAFTTWAGLGLEIHFLAAFFLLALLVARSRARSRGVYLGLALLGAHLTRPDAALFGGCLLASELGEALRCRRRGEVAAARRLVRDCGLAAACWLGPYLVYFAWHAWYYGALFPNTYYVKLGGGIDGWERGLAYVKDFLGVRAWLPVLALGAVFAVRDVTLRAVLGYVVLHVAYVIYVGGDFMPGHRFLVPQLPLFALLSVAALALGFELSGGARAKRPLEMLGLTRAHVAGFGAAIVLVAFAVLFVRGRELGPLHAAITDWREPHERQRRLLTWLRGVKPAGASFATGLIGHTGFYADVRVVDTFGIIDPVVARRAVATLGKGTAGHEKRATLDEVLRRQPTYVGIWVLGADLWKHGYFMNTDVPSDTVPGIWVRDELTLRGSVVAGTQFDFDATPRAALVTEGRAFEAWPARENGPGQGKLEGAEGGFLNSFHPSLGNRAKGKLHTTFELRGDRLIFRMAGGNDPQRLYAALQVDGKVVHRATGRNTDVLGRVDWDIRPYRGRRATFEVCDDSAEAWGYVALDELAQWNEGAERS